MSKATGHIHLLSKQYECVIYVFNMNYSFDIIYQNKQVMPCLTELVVYDVNFYCR